MLLKRKKLHSASGAMARFFAGEKERYFSRKSCPFEMFFLKFLQDFYLLLIISTVSVCMTSLVSYL
jgi:hypothetical protein